MALIISSKWWDAWERLMLIITLLDGKSGLSKWCFHDSAYSNVMLTQFISWSFIYPLITIIIIRLGFVINLPYLFLCAPENHISLSSTKNFWFLEGFSFLVLLVLLCKLIFIVILWHGISGCSEINLFDLRSFVWCIFIDHLP